MICNVSILLRVFVFDLSPLPCGPTLLSSREGGALGPVVMGAVSCTIRCPSNRLSRLKRAVPNESHGLLRPRTVSHAPSPEHNKLTSCFL